MTPKRTRQAEAAISTRMKIYLGPYWRVDQAHDWSLSMAFYFKNKVRGDLDNLQKMVLDALQGVLFENDKRVTHLEASIASCASLEPGIAILAVPIDPVAVKAHSQAAHLGSC